MNMKEPDLYLFSKGYVIDSVEDVLGLKAEVVSTFFFFFFFRATLFIFLIAVMIISIL